MFFDVTFDLRIFSRLLWVPTARPLVTPLDAEEAGLAQLLAKHDPRFVWAPSRELRPSMLVIALAAHATGKSSL